MPGDYTHRILIAAPAAMQGTANAIGRAIDPDVGGHRCFDTVSAGPDGETVTHMVCDALIRAAFATQAQAMLTNPALLHGACAADYAARWPDHTPPTLAECEAFVAGSTIEIRERNDDETTDDLLSAHGLTRILPSNDEAP